MNSEEERLNEVKVTKIGSFLSLGTIWFLLLFFEYSFNDLLYNGLILFASTIFVYSIIANDKFYIHTGYKEKEHEEAFRVFCSQYPGYAIYVKLLSFIVISLLVISIGLMIVGAIGYFQK